MDTEKFIGAVLGALLLEGIIAPDIKVIRRTIRALDLAQIQLATEAAPDGDAPVKVAAEVLARAGERLGAEQRAREDAMKARMAAAKNKGGDS